MPIGSVKSGNVINTYDQIMQLQKWTMLRESTIADMAEVDLTLNEICRQSGCEHYKDILVLWYVEGMNKNAVARKMGYSEHSIPYMYRLRNRALKKFAVSLYGVEAL